MKGVVTSLTYVPKTFFSMIMMPKNIFFNDYDVVFNAFAENKFIFKENYVLQ